MGRKRLRCGPWEVECLPQDGGRISVLRFGDTALLTPEPAHFIAPDPDYGQYETRPVYGYDDCFPSVAACRYPLGERFNVPDHGELCWLPWEVACGKDHLECVVRSRLLPIEFHRLLKFSSDRVTWEFQVHNESGQAVAFLHVMHPLMPRGAVCGLELPAFQSTFEGLGGRSLDVETPGRVADYLLNLPSGQARMVLLRGLQGGRARVVFDTGVRLTMEFSPEMFPTLGIWWNNGGYPDEDGCRRVECALEPIPGTSGSLADSYRDGTYLTVGPNERRRWRVRWTMS